MEPNIQRFSSHISNVRQAVFPLERWTITTREGIIMQSKCTCRSAEHVVSPAPHGRVSPDQVQNERDLDKEPIELCDICRYHKNLPQLNSMPDMLFNNNLFRLEHISGVGIEFNPLDALRKVEATQDPLRVAVADGWQSARADFPFAKSISRPFDWTFTTDYRGTLLAAIKKTTRSNDVKPTADGPQQQSSDSIERSQQLNGASGGQLKLQHTNNNTPGSLSSLAANHLDHMIDLHHISDAMKTGGAENRLTLKVEETDERINIEKLKQKDEILFYNDITLYEDELADHGTAQYSVKVRVMPNSVFVLARFYLRIDGVLARINDTRLYHEINASYILREYTNREAKLTGMDLPTSTVINPNELMSHLPLIHSRYEKLTLPDPTS